MKTFKAILSVKHEDIDYIIFDSESKETATKYAVSRFEKAYPLHTIKEEYFIFVMEEN